MHSSPDQLALTALGEPLPAADAAHLAGCRQCRSEVAALRRPVAELRGTAATDAPPVRPPDRVWTAIAAATGVAATPRTLSDPSLPIPRGASPTGRFDTAPVPGPSRPAGPPSGRPDPPAAHPAAGSSATGPDELDTRRARHRVPGAAGRRRRLVVAAVAAGLLVGGAVGAGITAALTATTTERLAAAVLEPFDDPAASGSATLVEESGRVSLQVDLQAEPPPDGYFEVWLLAEDGDGLLSLGILDGGTATLPVPAAVDLADYPTVDISLEPADGDPQHSTTSVARGSLT